VTRNIGEGDQTISLDDLRRDPGRIFRPLHVPRQPMTRRFSEFSRLFWQSLRPQPGLHPAMRARMWKPGQSGNPAGVRKAHPVELSSGAERTRRWREKRRQGVVVVSFDVAPDVTARLIRSGWLDATGAATKRRSSRRSSGLRKGRPSWG
jgi:hypothetical protein